MTQCPLFAYQTKSEIERRRRIRVALWAYAYEYKNDPLISDDEFDKECRAVDLSIPTGDATMDEWFRKEFIPDTGQWIRKHPNLTGIERIYEWLKR